MALNVIPGDGTTSNIYVRDRATGRTELASPGLGGGLANGTCEGPSLSSDGRFVAFYSDASNLVPDDTNGVGDIFVRDLKLGTTERVSLGRKGVQGNGPTITIFTTISADGRVVPFASEATNLVSRDTNGAEDVFVRSSDGK